MPSTCSDLLSKAYIQVLLTKPAELAHNLLEALVANNGQERRSLVLRRSDAPSIRCSLLPATPSCTKCVMHRCKQIEIFVRPVLAFYCGDLRICFLQST